VTTFVECGPLFVVSPGWRARITPFPAERGMGWGLELDFARLRPDGCLLGIVDAVRIRHLGTVGSEYETRARTEAMRAELAEHGVREWSELQQTLATWWAWEKRPPWAESSSTPAAPAVSSGAVVSMQDRYPRT
jgi:hypothetical protein